MSNELRILGPYSAVTGYSKAVRAALRTALLAGYTVQAIESDGMVKATQKTDGSVEIERVPPKKLVDLPEVQDREFLQCKDVEVAPDAPSLLFQLPHNLNTWPQYAVGPVMGWTMTESDGMCAGWQHGCRNVDLLLAPSNYCLDTFRRTMPDVRSALMPIPVDDRLWLPDEYRDAPEGAPPFLFLSVFAVSERKNWRMLIQAFAEEFCDEGKEVGLVVRPTGDVGSVAFLIGHCQSMGAWIYLDHNMRTDWTMAALYRACNVVVQPSSEGFGLPMVEAAMLGKPSIALPLSGSADVVTEETGYLVPNCTMAPLIGHMPAIYPRTHRFATCDIDSLRIAMRRAYEEERSETGGKGKAARAEAIRKFTPEALAPTFRARVDEAIEAYHLHRTIVAPKQAPRWACAFGAWGDVFAACGKIRKLMEEWRLEEIGVVWYGSDTKVAEWLGDQPWVREVIAIHEPDVKTMTRNFGRACQCRPIHSRAWLREIAMERGLFQLSDIASVAFTQLRLNEKEMPTYWHGAVLSETAEAWAAEQAEKIGNPFYLLQPLSIASNKMRDHWRYWSEAMTWLLENTDETYALVSADPIDWPDSERLVNLSGQSRSMQDVLALAKLAKGAISTSNNLGIFAPIVGIPSLIVCARTCGRDTFYHRWMECDGIYLIDFEDAMPQFLSALGRLFLGGKLDGNRGDRASGNGHGAVGEAGSVSSGDARRETAGEGAAVS